MVHPLSSIDSNISQDQMQLTAVLTQCFGTIFIGYIAGRAKLFRQNGIKGLNRFMLYFSLPSMIFISLAKTHISFIDWSLVLSVLIAKFLLFILVACITLMITKKNDIGKAGFYGILCSQSNDFAIGHPLLKSLYFETYPHLPNYLYVFAPLQLAIINPIGLFMMEWSTLQNRSQKFLSLILLVIFRTFTNPIIIATLLGLLWNFIIGPEMPLILSEFIQKFADAFSSTVLFLLGTSMVGKFSNIKLVTDLHVPCTLTAVKLIFFPLLLRFIIQNFVSGTSPYVSVLSDFGFLYGTIPIAPTVVIFAMHYGISSTIASTTLILSTFISSPLMFVSSNMVLQYSNVTSIVQSYIRESISIIGLISFICGFIILVAMALNKKRKSITYQCTMLLIISQIILALGGYFKGFENSVLISAYHLLSTYGTFSCRIMTILIAFSLIFFRHRSNYFVHLFQNLMICAVIVVIIFTLALLKSGYLESGLNEPFYHELFLPTILLTVLIISLIIALVAIIIFKRTQIDINKTNEEKNQRLWKNQEDEFSNEIDLLAKYDVSYLDIKKQKKWLNNLKRYQDIIEKQPLIIFFPTKDETFSHLTLLILLIISMFIQLAIVAEKLMKNEFNSGILLELKFLDIFTNYGQAICSAIIFFDFNLFPYCFKKSANHTDEIRRICENLKSMHLTYCDEEICFKIGKYKIFEESRFINWLIQNGIANDRSSAFKYVAKLLESQVAISLNNGIFIGSSQLYKFKDLSNLSEIEHFLDC